MARDKPRLRRVEDQLQRELAQLVQRDLKDPRITGMITITAVEVTKEMEHATVFFTVMGGDENSENESVRVLSKAAGFLRREVGQRLRMRHIPELRFKYDTSVESGVRLAHLIDTARQSDEHRRADVSDDEPSPSAADDADAQ